MRDVKRNRNVQLLLNSSEVHTRISSANFVNDTLVTTALKGQKINNEYKLCYVTFAEDIHVCTSLLFKIGDFTPRFGPKIGPKIP